MTSAVCEIGAGSWRFAEEVITALHPDRYEIYETARDWLPWLSRLPGAVIQKCDGRTLSQTPDGSIDLVHAHKVFVYIEFCIPAGYLEEMARVVRPGCVVAFDIVTEGMPGRRGGPGVGSGRLVLPSYPQGMGGRVYAAARSGHRRFTFFAAAARDHGASGLPPRQWFVLTRGPVTCPMQRLQGSSQVR